MRELDSFERRIVAAVEEDGVFFLSVAPRAESDDPQEWFTYSIGLPKSRGWPELICFGLSAQAGCGVLEDVIAECDAKSITPTAGMILAHTLNGFDALLVDGSQIADHYLGSANWFGRYAGLKSPPDRLQLPWPDKAGRFPTDPSCDPDMRLCQTPLEKS